MSFSRLTIAGCDSRSFTSVCIRITTRSDVPAGVMKPIQNPARYATAYSLIVGRSDFDGMRAQPHADGCEVRCVLCEAARGVGGDHHRLA